MRNRLLIFCILCLPLATQAQSHIELSINGGGGLSSLQYNPTSGGQKPGFGPVVGGGLHFFVNPHWGIGTGVNFTLYNATTTLHEYTATSAERTANVINPTDFIFSYTYHYYEERQRASMLTIPLMIHYQTRGATAFYASTGVKIGIPLSADYTAQGNYSTDAYFPSTNVRYDSLYSYGFGDYTTNEENAALKLNISFMASLELGAKFSLDKWLLYVGYYLDYGLNDIRNDKRQAPLVGYLPETPRSHSHAGILNMSNSLRTLATGITLRVAFPLINEKEARGFGKSHRGLVIPRPPATIRFQK